MGRASRAKTERRNRVELTRPEQHFAALTWQQNAALEVAHEAMDSSERIPLRDGTYMGLVMVTLPELLEIAPPTADELDAILRARGYDPDVIRAESVVLSLLGDWIRQSIVVVPDEDLMLALSETPLPDDAPLSVLSYLPFDMFYVQTQLEDSLIRGTYVQVVRDVVDGEAIALFHELDNREEARGEGTLPDLVPMVFGLDGTIGEEAEGWAAILSESNNREKVRKVFGANSLGEKSARPDDIIKVSLDLTRNALLPLLLYLASEEPDLENASQERVGKRTSRSSHPVSRANIINVGHRIGAQLRASTPAAHTEVGRNAGGRRSPRPHIRAGHFHRFWVGPRNGERRMILRWLAPTGINTQFGSPQVTLRPVRLPASPEE